MAVPPYMSNSLNKYYAASGQEELLKQQQLSNANAYPLSSDQKVGEEINIGSVTLSRKVEKEINIGSLNTAEDSITLERTADSRWISVPVNCIKGNPSGATKTPQKCWIKLDLDYIPPAQGVFLNVMTHIIAGDQHFRHLVDKDRIILNGEKLSSLNINLFDLFRNIVTSHKQSFRLDFTQQAVSPRVEINY